MAAMISSLDRLLAIMAQLRDPQRGCPWDREQNFSTIAPYTIEEAYEVADAIARGDMSGLRDELGDLLFQVVFHARMAEEAGLFGFEEVAEGVVDEPQLGDVFHNRIVERQQSAIAQLHDRDPRERLGD